MAVRTTAWPAGTPCWVDISTDVTRAKAFYGPLLGWEFTEGDPEFGGYSIISKDGHRVAGIGPEQPDAAPGWVTYLASDDVAASLRAVTGAGGRVVADRMPIGDQGVMAIAVDPAGGVFGLWESGTNTGTATVDVPGSLVWNEHISGEYEAAKRFYAEVFGCSFADVDGAGGSYCVVEVAGAARPVGGIGDGEGQGWSTYFQVDDTDTAVKAAQELGGTLLGPVEDTPWGRMAVLADDQGTRFSVMGNIPQE